MKAFSASLYESTYSLPLPLFLVFAGKVPCRIGKVIELVCTEVVCIMNLLKSDLRVS